MGNPLDPTPKPIVDKLCHAVQDPRNHRYSTATGIFSLKREVGLLYERRYGVKIDPANEIICTIGSKEAYSHLCLALLGPGDTAIVPQPASRSTRTRSASPGPPSCRSACRARSRCCATWTT